TQNDEIKNSEPWGLPLKYKILPEYFKDLGYITHAIGKWHLGFFRKEYTPLMRGFDHHFGFWTSHHGYYDHCSHEATSGADDGTVMIRWERGQSAGGCNPSSQLRFAGRQCGRQLACRGSSLRICSTSDCVDPARRAGFLFSDRFYIHLGFGHDDGAGVARADSGPLLLYISHQAVRVGNWYHPLEAPAEHVKKFEHIQDTGRRMHAAMLSALDESLGRVFEALREKHVLEDTVVAFLSSGGGDAFAPAAGSNWPLRGSKGSLWEGGNANSCTAVEHQDIDEHHQNLALSKLVSVLGVRVLNGVDTSTQEPGWILVRLGKSKSSRQIAFIPTMHPDERVRVRKQQ
ncbi:hypothetical protein MRX96_011826, partial [Rhipicephalus microplus]